MPHDAEHDGERDLHAVGRSIAGQWVRRAVLIAVSAVVALLVCACSPTPSTSTSDPAALAVNRLLELRYSRSRDTTAYALFFKNDAIPKSLAAAAAKETSSTKPPIPDWQPPYVSAETSATVDVTVIWKGSSDFPNHPAATVFTLEKFDNRWVVKDAQDFSDVGKVPPPLKR